MFRRIEYQNHPYIKWTHTVEDRAFEALNGGMHYDKSLIMTYLVHGTGQLLVEGSDYALQSGDMLILNSKEFHLCRFDKCADHERISVYIGAGLAEAVSAEPEELYAAFTGRALGNSNVISASAVQALHIGKLLKEIATERGEETKEDYDLKLTCQSVQLLLLLKKALFVQDNSGANTQKNELVVGVIHYINEHITEPLSVSVLADALFIDKSYLCRTFHRFTGMTPGQYISGRRVERAIELLTDGADCTDACFKSGFGNYSSFYKAFKKHTGEEPNDYKKVNIR